MTVVSVKDKLVRRMILTEEMIIGVSLIFEGQSAVADMVQVLQPLKIGDGHTTSVQVHILFRTMECDVTFLPRAGSARFFNQ